MKLRKARFDAYGTPYHLIMGGKGLSWQDTGYVRRLPEQKLNQKNLATSDRQHAIDNIIESQHTKSGIIPKQLQCSSRAGQIPCIRSHIAHALVGEPGLSCAEITHQPEVFHVAVLKMMKKED